MVGVTSWKVTAPSTCPLDPLDRQTMHSSGTCLMIVGSQSVRQEDLRLPLQLGVVLLVDVLHLLHEGREVAELGPLVIGHPADSIERTGDFPSAMERAPVSAAMRPGLPWPCCPT
jgi:hypothetical protein